MAEQINEQEKALQQVADTLESFPVYHMVESLEVAVKTIRAQAEKIEHLNKMRGVTQGELAMACKTWADSNDDRYLSTYLSDYLRSKGLLIEDNAQPMQEPQSKPTHAEVEDFNEQLRSLINRNSRENASNTSDFILAQYLEGCLLAFETAVQQRETWHGRDARPSEISPNKHRDFMVLPVEERRKQMEAQCTPEMVKHYEQINEEDKPLPPPLGIDKAEVERFVNNIELDACPSVDYICEWLDRHGLLLDNQPKPIQHWRDGGKACDIEQPAQADPLKVDVSEGRYPPREMEVRRAHNVLVDKCYELTNGLGVNMLRWEEVKLELRKLEQRLSQPAEQEAWPKLPGTGHIAFGWQFLREELARIRTRLQVKEAE